MGHEWGTGVYGGIERLNRLGARLPALVNWASGLAVTRWLLEMVVSIDHRRPLPKLASETFTAWFNRHAPPAETPRGEAVLFHDTVVTYDKPVIGRADVEL